MTQTTNPANDPTPMAKRYVVACPWCGALAPHPAGWVCAHCGHDLEVAPAHCSCELCERAHEIIDEAFDQTDTPDLTLILGSSVYQITDGLDRYGFAVKGSSRFRPWHPLNTRMPEVHVVDAAASAKLTAYVRP